MVYEELEALDVVELWSTKMDLREPNLGLSFF